MMFPSFSATAQPATGSATAGTGPSGGRRCRGRLRYPGRPDALPVSFVRTGDLLVAQVAAEATTRWWRDCCTPQPVTIRNGGDRVAGIGRVVTPAATEYPTIDRMFRQAYPPRRAGLSAPYLLVTGAAPGSSAAGARMGRAAEQTDPMGVLRAATDLSLRWGRAVIDTVLAWTTVAVVCESTSKHGWARPTMVADSRDGR